jgi:hypothetical protein
MIVTSKFAIKYVETYLIFFQLFAYLSPKFFFPDTVTIPLILHVIIPHIYAPVLLIFHPFLRTKTGSTRGSKHSKFSEGRRKTVHIIGIEQVQTSSDPFSHVKHSRSATATERNWDVTETFLSVWTSPLITHEKILLNGDVPRRNETETWRRCSCQCEHLH